MSSNLTMPPQALGSGGAQGDSQRTPHIIRSRTASPDKNKMNQYTIKLRERIVEIYGSNRTVWALPPLMKVHTPCHKFGLSCPPEYVEFLEDILRQALRENPTCKLNLSEGCDIVLLNLTRWVFTGDCVPVENGSKAAAPSYLNSSSAGKIGTISGSCPTTSMANEKDPKSPSTHPMVSFTGNEDYELERLTLLDNLQQYVRVLENKLAQVRRARWYGEAPEGHRTQTGDLELSFRVKEYAIWISKTLQEKTGAERYTRCAEQKIKTWLIEIFFVIDWPLNWLFYYLFLRLLPCSAVVAFGVWVWADLPWPDSVVSYVLNLPKARPEGSYDENQTKMPVSHLKASFLHAIAEKFGAEGSSCPFARSRDEVEHDGVVQTERSSTSLGLTTLENEKNSTQSPKLASHSVQEGSEREKALAIPSFAPLHTRPEDSLNIFHHPMHSLTGTRTTTLEERQYDRQVAVSFTLIDDYFNIDSTYFLFLRLRLAFCLFTLLALLWCSFECYRYGHRIFADSGGSQWLSRFESSSGGNSRESWLTINRLHLHFSSALSVFTSGAGRFLRRLLPSWMSASIGLYVLYSFLGSVVLVAFRETFSAFQELLDGESESAVRQIPILRLDPVVEME
ncbi:unnamed protein product [Phytomonas sp. Hart1]|nr:unnamed protein product [Phytomonas sp. Hart1]|eukprot:CCW67385.1 unnamed protein product [Phytomonas sp. isolate Hart1]